jgi:Membrane protein involved in the export of O-antigen and teichoic acid
MFKVLKFRFKRHRDTLLFTCSNVFLAAATFLGSFVCARLLLPEQLGAFQTALLLVSYLGFLPLGVFNGFNRQYPYLLGKGEFGAATVLACTGYSVARVTAATAALLAIGQVLILWNTSSDRTLILVAVVVIPIAAFSQLNGLQVAILVGRQAFGWIARVQFAIALITLALLPLVWKFKVEGQCIRLILLAAVPFILYWFKTADARTWHWDSQEIGELIRRGVPIMAIGYLYQVFSVADRTLIAWVRGSEAVGHYALAGLAVAAIQSVYTPLAVAIYAKANRAFGQSHSIAALIRPVKIFLLLLSVSVVPVAILIYYCLPLFVPWVLPNYVAGIRAGQIACIASIAFCYCGTAFVFNVTGHNWFYGILMGCALTVFFVIGFQTPKQELTLDRVAWLRAGISIGICLLINAYVMIYLRRGRNL